MLQTHHRLDQLRQLAKHMSRQRELLLEAVVQVKTPN